MKWKGKYLIFCNADKKLTTPGREATVDKSLSVVVATREIRQRLLTLVQQSEEEQK